MGDEVDKKPEAGSAEHINLKVVGQVKCAMDSSEFFSLESKKFHGPKPWKQKKMQGQLSHLSLRPFISVCCNEED